MMHLRKKAAKLICVCLLLQQVISISNGEPNSADEIARIYKNGKKLSDGINLVDSRSEPRIKVAIRVESFSPNWTNILKPSFFWGAFQEKPEKLLCNLTVSIKGQEIPIKQSAYLDLADPNCIDVEYENKQVVIRIVGGDALTSYVASLRFVNFTSYGFLLKERFVYLGEFPKNNQRTLYGYDPDETD